MRSAVLILMIVVCTCSNGQVFTAELLDGTEALASTHPTEAFIFHINSFNSSSETVLIELLKSNELKPESWDISICSNVCLPPEIDELTYFIPANGMTEVSVYFFADTPGIGSVDLLLTYPDNPSESYEYTFTLTASETTGSMEFIQTVFDFNYHPLNSSLSFETSQSGTIKLWNSAGQEIARKAVNSGQVNWNIPKLDNGIYIADFETSSGISHREKIFIGR